MAQKDKGDGAHGRKAAAARKSRKRREGGEPVSTPSEQISAPAAEEQPLATSRQGEATAHKDQPLGPEGSVMAEPSPTEAAAQGAQLPQTPGPEPEAAVDRGTEDVDGAGEEKVPSEAEAGQGGPSSEAPINAPRGRRPRERTGASRSNALGTLIERRFADPSSPVRSYSELERRSGISREALSRYVTPRADRRRSPTIDTLDAIADAMHMSLEQACRAAVASAHGLSLPQPAEQQARDEVLSPLIAALSGDQFAAVVELLRQMQPRPLSDT
jgi:transcriptional regulator with XRE-family HTH domain